MVALHTSELPASSILWSGAVTPGLACALRRAECPSAPAQHYRWRSVPGNLVVFGRQQLSPGLGPDPSRLHGPYWLFSTKAKGKTVNERLSEREGRLFEQIANERILHALLGEMRAVAAEAQALILAEKAPDAATNEPGTVSSETCCPTTRRQRTSA